MNGRICRACGCTDDRACSDGRGSTCYWIEPDLCSACEDVADEEYPRLARAGFVMP